MGMCIHLSGPPACGFVEGLSVFLSACVCIVVCSDVQVLVLFSRTIVWGLSMHVCMWCVVTTPCLGGTRALVLPRNQDCVSVRLCVCVSVYVSVSLSVCVCACG